MIDGLDLSALAAGYLVVAADLFDTESVAGGPALIGGPTALWTRSMMIRFFAEPVAGVEGLFRLTFMSGLYDCAPGIFHSIHRDRPGTAFRVIMTQCQKAAEDARLNFAATDCGYPLGTAEAAANIFRRSHLELAWSIPSLPPQAGSLLTQLPVFANRLALSATGSEGILRATRGRRSGCRYASICTRLRKGCLL